MANALYIAATEARSGKTAITLGVMELLLRKVHKVGFFRPIIRKDDDDIKLVSSIFNLKEDFDEMYGVTVDEAAKFASMGRQDEVIEKIIKKYNELKEKCDFVLCEGTDFVSSTAVFEFDINADIIKNFACPVLLVANGRDKKPVDIVQGVEAARDSLTRKRCRIIGVIINRADSVTGEAVVAECETKEWAGMHLIYALPERPSLNRPSVKEVADVLDAEVLYGQEDLARGVHVTVVAAMQLRNFLKRIKFGTLVVTPGDRADVIVACLATVSSTLKNKVMGLVLTGGLTPDKPVMDLIDGFTRMVPILSVQDDTFPAARKIDRIHSRILPENLRKITRILAHFEKYVDVKKLGEKVIATKCLTVTPKMFEYGLLQKARRNKQHIVLPEGTDERILRATETLLKRDVADITLLGNRAKIYQNITRLGLKIDTVNIIDPLDSPHFKRYVQNYYDLRKHKGITEEYAYDIMSSTNYYGTMMVYKGEADGMVSGAAHSTASTIRPALQIIKTKPGVSVVSGVFLMCLENEVLVYGDCAVNPDPDADMLAEIAINSAQTAKVFGIDPVVAMLSYSTGESGKGMDVDKVREATLKARHKAEDLFPGLKIEGPIQYDAAVDATVARTKLPDSDVAGKATVFVFPDLNTGNNTYKAVQRSANAVAVGPILQGLRFPVNDLSRGCLVSDIVNTVAFTAIQAQADNI